MKKHRPNLFHASTLGLSPLMCLLAAQVAIAEPDRADRSLAAGYKAMFTCSAVFNGGKSQNQINQDELSNIYSDYTEGMAAVADPIVNRAEKYVAVPFADDMPPRISAWRPHLGCTALPPGATEKSINISPS